VIFWGEKKTNFTSLQQDFLNAQIDTRWNIAEWFFLILLTGVSVWYFGIQNPLLLILLFPLLTLLLESSSGERRTPIAILWSDILSLFSRTKYHVDTLQNTKVEERFLYTTTESNKESTTP
jgi:hypothetical protein